MFRVVDDEGRPVGGVKAEVSWEKIKATTPSERIDSADGVTNEAGVVTLGGKTSISGVSYGANKEGYYSAWGLRYHFNNAQLFRWQPWNPTIDVVLKRKKNPVAMYVKRVRSEIPVSGVDVGYDLAVGDWIKPHGKGKVADMIFHSIAEVKDDTNYRGELTVSFPGQGNGLVPFEVLESKLSRLRMPYEAPPDAYQSLRVWRSVRQYNPDTMESGEYINDSSENLNFFIRVRAELDAEGKVVKAMYGKIHAPFNYGPRGFNRKGATGRQSVYFIYYLNPDGTRNIEFDPQRNLLSSAKRDDIGFIGLEP